MGQKIKDEIIFAGSGLDLDSDSRFLQKGDTDSRVNLIPSADGSAHILTSVKGNYEIQHSIDLSAMTDPVVVGSCYSSADDMHYFFMVGTNGVQAILRYNVGEDEIEKVLVPYESGVTFGYLYKGYTLNDVRGIPSSASWRVPTNADITSLSSHLDAIGSGLKKAGGYWLGANPVMTDDYGMGVYASGVRGLTGNFSGLGSAAYFWTSTEESSGFNYMWYLADYSIYIFQSDDRLGNGFAIRLFRDAGVDDPTDDGDPCEDYVGNDGRVYPTVRLGDFVILATNLAETEFANNDEIPLLISDEDWVAETIGMCSYQNRSDYVETKYLFSNLGYTQADRINDAFVLDSFLFWNTKTSSPRSLNIDWAINFMNYIESLGKSQYVAGDKFYYGGWVFDVTTTSWDYQVLDDIRNETYALCSPSDERYYFYQDTNGIIQDISSRPFYNYASQPLSPATFSFFDDPAVNINNIKGGVFQFAYRYVYADGTISLYSPYSDVATTISGEGLLGEEITSAPIGNKIVLSLLIPDNRSELDSIEVVFRRSLGDGWGLWSYAGKLDKGVLFTSGTTTFDFYNNVVQRVIDQSEVNNPFHALPLMADTQASLMNNRVAYGGITEGFNVPVPDVDLTVEFVEIEGDYSGELGDELVITYHAFVDWDDHGSSIIYDYAVINIPDRPDIGDVVKITIDSNLYTYLVPDKDLAGVLSGIALLLTNAGYLNVSVVSSNDGVEFVMRTELQWLGGSPIIRVYATTVSASEYGSVSPSFGRHRGFKSGATHGLCLFYYEDLLRRSEAIESDGLSFYVPFITEETVVNAGWVHKHNVAWEINHRPPSWARYWRFGYAGNTSVGNFVQYSVSSISTPGNTEIDITPLQTITVAVGDGYTKIPNSNIDAYEFNHGDRIRFITPQGGEATVRLPLQEDEYGVSGYLDFEILEYDESNKKIIIDGIGSIVTAFDLGAGSIVEIYTPKKASDDVVYYEIGSLRPVITGTDGLVYHGGDSQDQNLDEYGVMIPATGVITDGDIYHVVRLFSFKVATSATVPYPVESYSASDFYDSKVWASGRSGFATNIGQKKLNNIRWSDPLIQDTKINGLSSFQPDSVVAVNRKHGDITAMQEVGHTLKVLQQSNNVSFGVGRTQYEDANGKEYAMASDRILGVQRVSTSGYGCINPESVLKVGHRLYWFDALKGCMVRDAGGGAFPISGRYSGPEGSADYKMERYFQEVARQVRENGLKVFLGWDEGRKLLYAYSGGIVES